jgi:hypothetical protein
VAPPRVRIRLPEAAENFLDAVSSLVSAAGDVVSRGKRVVRKAKRVKRAGRRAASDLRAARPRILLDGEAGEVRIDLGRKRNDEGDDS